MKGLVAGFAVKEQVPFLNESIMDAFYTHDRSFVRRLQFADTLIEVLTHHTQYHFFDASHHTLEFDPFHEETTV